MFRVKFFDCEANDEITINHRGSGRMVNKFAEYNRC